MQIWGLMISLEGNLMIRLNPPGVGRTLTLRGLVPSIQVSELTGTEFRVRLSWEAEAELPDAFKRRILLLTIFIDDVKLGNSSLEHYDDESSSC